MNMNLIIHAMLNGLLTFFMAEKTSNKMNASRREIYHGTNLNFHIKFVWKNKLYNTALALFRRIFRSRAAQKLLHGLCVHFRAF